MSESVFSQGGITIASAAPPYLKCIQWVPRRFAGGVSPVTIVDLVFEQRVFGQVAEHVAAVPGSPVFGALVGHVFEDPTCERRWARVERAIQSPTTIPESSDASRLGQTLRATEMEWAPEQDEVLLGWYRTHLEGGLYLSPDEARFHEGGFRDPWSVALVLAGTGERRAGGVFQRTDPEGLSRSVYTPFYELVDPSSEFNGTTKRTFVGWANYQTEARVVRAGHGNVSAELPPRSPGPRAPGKTLEEKTPATGETPAPKTSATDTSPGARVPATGPIAPATPTTSPRAEPAPTTGAKAPASTRTTSGPPQPVGPIEPPGSRPASPTRGSKPAEPARKPATAEEPVNSEAELAKRQIQRSLMAVGRSLGPSDLGPIDTRATSGAESAGRGDEGDAVAKTPPSGAPVRDTPARPTEESSAARATEPDPRPTVIPINRDQAGSTGLVGHSRRRRRRLPVGKILAAAAGLTLVAAAGLVGTRTMMRDGAAAEGPAGTMDGSAMAGLTLSPDELRGRDRDAGPGPEAAPGAAALSGDERAGPAPVTDSLSSSGAGDETGSASDTGPDAETTADAPDEAASTVGTADTETSSATTGPGGETRAPEGRAREIVGAPSLEGLQVEDPVVAVYESALAIFRQETDRYDEVRRAFDDGSETCNPLNLSYRGVRDAFERLERRLSDAGERLSAAALRSFDGAERQFAMSRTHYVLTDCPMPVGG